MDHFKFLVISVILIFGRLHVCRAAYCGFPGTSVNSRVEFSSDSLTTGTFAAYSCDDGYRLLGSKSRYCLDEGKWSGSLPVCVVNVALNKPANASSWVEGGNPEHGNDGNLDNRHRKQFCVETNREDKPWWKVDLLASYEVFGVLIVSNADTDFSQQVGNLRIRVGNSINVVENQLCEWIPDLLDPGTPREVVCPIPIRGRYISIHSESPNPAVLTFCEAQVFSSQELPSSKCPVQSAQTYVFQHRCYDIHTEAKTTVAKASKNCQDNSGTLVTKVNAATQQFLDGTLARLDGLKVFPSSSNVWTGLSRSPGGQPWSWHWPNNGSLNETFWGAGQPSVFDTHVPVCAAMSSDLDHHWKDMPCTEEANWICQYDPLGCGSPEIKPNSTVIGKKPVSRITDVIQYQCSVGSQMLGGGNRTCLRDGTWGPDPPWCRYKDCGELPKTRDSVTFMLQGRSTYGGEAEYACTGNLSLIGNSRTYCTGDGWAGTPPECRYVNCGFLPPIGNGAALLLDGGTFYKARARYECTENYTLVGPTMLTCNENSTWNESIPLCKLKECPPVAPFLNGRIIGSNYSLGMQLNYVCSEGFYLSNDVPNIRTCMPDQKWNTAAPTCVPIDCGMPETLANGTFSLLDDGTTYNKTVVYGCEKNFALVGDQQRHCTLAALWSSDPPKCVVSACKAPELSENDMLVDQNFSVGIVLDFSCKPGYRAQGVQNYTCHPDGYWTGTRPFCHFLDCGAPPTTKHGSFRTSGPQNGLGTIATYACDGNTTMLGDSVMYCTEQEVWSGYAPTCIGCGAPDVADRGIVRGTDYSLNSTVDYSCEPGYRLIGQTRRACLYPGNWNSSAPACEEILCKLPTAPVNGTLSTKKPVKVGSSLHFICHPGHFVVGPATATCSFDGVWDVEPPTCKYIYCGRPPEVRHSKASYNGTTYGAMVKYICKDGYFLHGKSDIFCTETGKWERVPECNTSPVEEKSGQLLDDEPGVIPKKSAEGSTNNSASQLGMGIGIAVACLLVILTFVGSVIWIKLRGRKAHSADLPIGRTTYVDPNFSFRPKAHVQVTKAYVNDGFDSTAL